MVLKILTSNFVEKFPFRLRKGKAEGGFGGNSAFPLRNQIEASPATCLNTWKAEHHRKILFSLKEEKIGRAQIKKCRENFFAERRAAAGLRFGRRAKIPSPQPPSFLPACLGFAQIFFGGNLLFIFSRPCPPTSNAGDTKELPKLDNLIC